MHGLTTLSSECELPSSAGEAVDTVSSGSMAASCGGLNGRDPCSLQGGLG